MDTLLEAIDVCDVDGFCYGNYTDEEAGTGCTVIVAPEGATGGVTFAAVLQHRAKPTCCVPRTPSTRSTPSAFRVDRPLARGCKRRRSRA